MTTGNNPPAARGIMNSKRITVSSIVVWAASLGGVAYVTLVALVSVLGAA